MNFDRTTAIRKTFKEYFNEKTIELPAKLELNKVGELDFVGSGWSIQYKLIKENDLYYLDFYASHRMTNSRHNRILETGELIALENFWEFGYVVYEDDPERTEKERNEMNLKNQQVDEILKKKGFI